jgi:acetylornithine deacetylase/succinyl-diaminopimelate desuccinylase family protein
MAMSLVETLADLVRINSVNPEWDGPGEREVAAYVKAFFEDAGIEVSEHEVLPNRPNILVRLPGRNRSRTVLFEVHLDTVSVDDMTIPPFDPEIRGGRLYGRGACDDKGSLAAMMHAVRDVHQSGKPPPCDVLLAAVSDEEHLHRGVNMLIEVLRESGDPLPVAAVVAEPTELRLARANKGVLRWRIATRGKSAHSSKPHLGVNAITAMTPVIQAIDADQQQLAQKEHPLVGQATCSIGLIDGGAQVNFVPEHCRITLDRRMLPGETREEVLVYYEAILDHVRSRNPGLSVASEAPYLADEAMETAANSPVVQVSSRVLDSMNLEPEPIGVPYGCDGTKLSRAGIPSVVFGPGSIDQAHAAVEYVAIDQVEKALAFYRQFLLDSGDDNTQ